MKKVLAALLCMAMAGTMIAGCGAAPAAPAAAPAAEATEEAAPAEEAAEETAEAAEEVPAADGTFVMGLSMNALDVAQTDVYNWIETYAKEAGIELVMFNADGKVEKQITDVESLIVQEPDLITILSVDPDGSVPAFEACADAGIPTIASSFNVNYDDTTKLLFDQVLAGQKQAEWLENWLEENPDAVLNIGYVWGPMSGVTNQDKYHGCMDKLLADYPDRVTILAEKDCAWKTDPAQAAVEDWIQAYPEMNCVLCQNDEMAVGASNALQTAGIGIDQCMVWGFGCDPASREAVREGTMTGGVLFRANKSVAKSIIDTACRIRDGEDLTGQRIALCEDVIGTMDVNNVDEVEKIFE